MNTCFASPKFYKDLCYVVQIILSLIRFSFIFFENQYLKI